MKDSTHQEVKLIEVNTETIRYNRFDFQDGPIYTISKGDVQKIKYQNGGEEMMPPSEKKEETLLYQKFDNIDSLKPIKTERKVGDYIRFNLQLATVMYHSFCNVPKHNEMGKSYSDEYKKVSDKQNVAISVGIGLILGKSPYVKHILGVNFLRTKGEFIYEKSNIGYSSYSKYKTIADFLNITTGIRLTLAKKVHIEPIVELNVLVSSRTTYSGTHTTIDWQTPPYTRYTSTFENESTNTLIGTTISLCPKISNELPVKKIKMEAYLSYNFALEYRLPWYQFGISIFPFKKLR